MRKYKAGDKVLIRKDLIVGEVYGDWYWSNGKEYMKNLDYVVIDKIDDDGDCWVEDGWLISEEMISHKYGEKNNEPPIAVEIRGGYCNQLLITIPSKTNNLHNNLEIQKKMLNKDFHEEVQRESLEVAEGVTVYMRDDLKKDEYYGGLMFDKSIYKQLDKYKPYKINVMYSNMCMLDDEYNTVVTKEMLITRQPSYIDHLYNEYKNTNIQKYNKEKDNYSEDINIILFIMGMSIILMTLVLVLMYIIT